MSVEFGNEYPLREETTQETSILPISLDVGTQVQNTLQSPEEVSDISHQVQEKLAKFKEFAEKNNISGYEIFETFMTQASIEVQTQFLDASNLRILRSKIQGYENFPVNEFEFRTFLITALDTETTVTEAEATVTEAEATRERERLLNFKNSLGNIQLSDPLLNSYFEQLVQLGPVNQDTAEAYTILGNNIKSRLESTQEIEKNILPQARASGNYEAVKNGLITLGGGENGSGGAFEARILAWELGNQPFDNLPAEQRVRTSAALLGTNVNEIDTDQDIRKSGNIFTLDMGNGEEINYDVVTGKRNISLDGYAIDASVEDTGDYQTPKLEYMRVEQEQLPILKKIQSVQDAINQKSDLTDDDIGEIKATIRKVLGVDFVNWGLDKMDNALDIKKELGRRFSESSGKLETARDTYQETLLELRDGQKAALEKKDKKVKQVLDFLQSIGITRIPQYITDTLIDAINTNTAIWSALGLQEKIDFSNGKLGFNKNAGGEVGLNLADKKAFVSLMNQMLTGNPKIPVEYTGSTIMYNIDTTTQKGETPDKAGKGGYQSFLARTVGDINFVSKAKRNLGLI